MKKNNMRQQSTELIRGISLRRIVGELTDVALGKFRTEYEVYRAVQALQEIDKYCGSVQTEENKEIQNLIENSLIIIRRNIFSRNGGVFYSEIFNVQVDNIAVTNIYEESIKELLLLTTPLYEFVFRGMEKKRVLLTITGFLKFFDGFQFEFMDEDLKIKLKKYREDKEKVEALKKAITVLREGGIGTTEKLKKIVLKTGEKVKAIRDFIKVNKEGGVDPCLLTELKNLTDKFIPLIHTNMPLCKAIALVIGEEKRDTTLILQSKAEKYEKRLYNKWVKNELNPIEESEKIVEVALFLHELFTKTLQENIQKQPALDLVVSQLEEGLQKQLENLKALSDKKSKNLIRKDILRGTLETRFSEIIKAPKIRSAFLSIVEGYEKECKKDSKGEVKIEEVFRLVIRYPEPRERFFNFQHIAFCTLKGILE